VAGRRTGDEEEETPRFQQGAPAGPFVAAGTYRVHLLVDGADSAQIMSEWPVEVRLDPHVSLTAEQYAALGAARMQVYRLQLRTQSLVGRLDQAKRVVEAAIDGRDEETTGPARAVLTDIDAALLALRPAARGGQGGTAAGGTQPLLTRINMTATALNGAHFIPTPDQLQTLQEAERELERTSTATDELLTRAESAARATAGG
jgi:hypothetical protein